MRYLAVPETPRRHLLVTLLHQSHWKPQWHAVADSSVSAMRALCGFSYRSEPHRMWDQSTLASRCPQCQRLMIAEDSLPEPDRIPTTPRLTAMAQVPDPLTH